ncbi:MAG TPA: phosphoribosylamine--glycine ligase [Candidatus Saccharimonadales bacterium]|nr:phosphoribosylamine--glycine ligase [Candidatus Saccharimonadales bacterium]
MIVGSGGREHALAVACHAQDAELFFSHANAGMERLGTDLDLQQGRFIISAARQNDIELAVIGPEQPLLAGLADGFRAEGVPTVGASSAMARLEGSKSFATGFMQRYGVPHPDTLVTASLEEAEKYVNSRKAREYVIKADGVAAGKGVKLPKNRPEAQQIVTGMMSGTMFGEAGQIINFQDCLHGEEVSMIALLDGKKAHVLGLAQDYKRLLDGDKGPNTGGMGSYSPVSPGILDDRQTGLMYEALDNTLNGLNREGINSPGFLYIGFMLADEFDGDPVVLEYNVRPGDPETQVIVPLLQDAGVDVPELLRMAAHGQLEGDKISTARRSGQFALSVCLAAEGYPDNPKTNDPVYSVNGSSDLKVYHGATQYRYDDGGRIFTVGGRVLYPTSLGDTPAEAAGRVYSAIGDEISFKGMQYRQDIGHQAIAASR